MNKAEFITKFSEKMTELSEKKVTKKSAEEALMALAAVVIEALNDGETVKIPDLGTFSAVDVAERTGIIQMGDRKGETYTTPAHKAPKFKPTSAFKEAIK